MISMHLATFGTDNTPEDMHLSYRYSNGTQMLLQGTPQKRSSLFSPLPVKHKKPFFSKGKITR
jgi:hypothetical protein